MTKPSVSPNTGTSKPVPFEKRAAILFAFVAAVCIFAIGLLINVKHFNARMFWGLVILASLAALPGFSLGRSVGQFLGSITKAQSAITLLHQQLAVLGKAFVIETGGRPPTQAEAEARLIVMARDEDVIKRHKMLRYYEPRSRLSTAWQYWAIHDRYLGAAVAALMAFIPLVSDHRFVRDLLDRYGSDEWGKLFIVVGIAAVVGAILHRLVGWTLRGRPGHADAPSIAPEPPGIDKKASKSRTGIAP